MVPSAASIACAVIVSQTCLFHFMALVCGPTNALREMPVKQRPSIGHGAPAWRPPVSPHSLNAVHLLTSSWQWLEQVTVPVAPEPRTSLHWTRPSWPSQVSSASLTPLPQPGPPVELDVEVVIAVDV